MGLPTIRIHLSIFGFLGLLPFGINSSFTSNYVGEKSLESALESMYS